MKYKNVTVLYGENWLCLLLLQYWLCALRSV